MRRDSRFRVVGWAESDPKDTYASNTGGYRRFVVIEETDADEDLPESQPQPLKHDAAQLWAEWVSHSKANGVTGAY
jgi:hypothetical protein